MVNVEESTQYHYEKVPTKEKINDIENVPPLHYGYGVRHLQSLLLFACLSIGFIARGHLGVTIVAMTHIPDVENSTVDNAKHLDEDFSRNEINGTLIHELNVTEDTAIFNIKGSENAIYDNENKSDASNESDGKWNVYKTYTWSKSVQEMVLGAFFLGYCIMMFPIGMVCQRWGGKIPLQIALFVNGIVSILTPWLAVWGGWKAVCMCRIAQGLSQAGVYPGIHTLLASWVPLSERGRLSSYVYTGTTFGTVIAFQLSGLLSDSKWGWPSTFWVTEVLCIIMFAMLTLFGAATPDHHKSISYEEKNFILGKVESGPKKKRATPWKAILTSKHVWATFVTHAGCGMSFVFFFTQVPTYMHYILGVNIKSSGLLSSLPYVASFFMCIGYGWLSDFCTNRKILSVRNARRISNTIAQVAPALCLAAVSFTRNTVLGVTYLVVSLALQAGVHTGWMVNYIDLAPDYSGTLMATGNTMANMFVLALPVLGSNIVTDVTNQFQWRIMLFLMAGVMVVSNAVFVIFMSADTEAWNDPGHATDEQQNEEKEALKEPA